jgi:hypothetical protein
VEITSSKVLWGTNSTGFSLNLDDFSVTQLRLQRAEEHGFYGPFGWQWIAEGVCLMGSFEIRRSRAIEECGDNEFRLVQESPFNPANPRFFYEIIGQDSPVSLGEIRWEPNRNLRVFLTIEKSMELAVENQVVLVKSQRSSGAYELLNPSMSTRYVITTLPYASRSDQYYKLSDLNVNEVLYIPR